MVHPAVRIRVGAVTMVANQEAGWKSAQSDPTAGLTIEGLFHTHIDDVHRIAARLLGPSATADDLDDVCQTVFIAVHRALPRFRGESKTSTWIYGITTRTVLQFLRGRRRYRQMVARFEANPVQPLRVVRPDETYETWEELRRLWRCLHKMKAKKRVVLILHEFEGKSTKEIAEILEIKEPTVRSRLHHARQELLATIDRLNKEETKR